MLDIDSITTEIIASIAVIFILAIFKPLKSKICAFLKYLKNRSVNTNIQTTKKSFISTEQYCILFIDDDEELKVSENIKATWSNTLTISDCTSINQIEIKNAHVIFVDINGVGKIMNFKDEGLGLAAAIKKSYPQKKVVIYSASKKHDIYHEAVKICDEILRKDASIYEFENCIQNFFDEENQHEKN